MTSLTILGLLAGFCTTIAFIPQVAKTWRTKSTNDLSLGMIAVYVLGIALWLIYGLALGDVPDHPREPPDLRARGLSALLQAAPWLSRFAPHSTPHRRQGLRPSRYRRGIQEITFTGRRT